MLHFPDPAKLKTRRVVFEEVFPAIDCGTLEQLKRVELEKACDRRNGQCYEHDYGGRYYGNIWMAYFSQRTGSSEVEALSAVVRNFVSHVEMLSSNNIMARWISNLRIQWTSMLASPPPFLNLMGPKFFQVDSIRIELGMVLFLHAALLRERAYKVLTSVDHTVQRSCRSSPLSSRDVIPSLQSQTSGQKPPEAASSFTAAMSLMCLAEAQAVTIRKAEEKKATASLVVKLHGGVGEFVNEAIHSLHSGATEVKDVSGQFMEYLSSVKELHELRSKRYLAQDLKSTEQIGLSIGILRQALVDAGKKIPGDESWRLVLRKEIHEVTDILRKYESENEIVWHQRIASGDELPAAVGSKISSIVNYHPTGHESPLVFKL